VPFTTLSAILAAKLQISVDFSAGFGRNMLQEVANCQFFCRRCRKVTEIVHFALTFSILLGENERV
jgi:hypothetical protein